MEEIAETKALREGSLIGHKVINRARSTISLFFPQGINTDQKQQKEEERKYLDPRRSLGDGLLI